MDWVNGLMKKKEKEAASLSSPSRPELLEGTGTPTSEVSFSPDKRKSNRISRVLTSTKVVGALKNKLTKYDGTEPVEVEFCVDEMGEQLKKLWADVDVIHQHGSPNMKEYEVAVNTFTSFFYGIYKDWDPDSMNLPPFESTLQVSCHPPRMCKVLTKYMRTFSATLSQAVSLCSDEHVERMPSLRLLEVMEIVSRSSLNRRVLRKYDLYSSLVRILKQCVHRMSTFVKDIEASTTASKPVVPVGRNGGPLCELLEIVMGHCLQAIANFVDGSYEWRKIGVLNPYSAPPRPRAEVALADSGGLVIFVELLKTIRQLASHVQLTEGQCVLQVQLLHVLGAVLRNDVACREKFRTAGGLELLMTLVGWPPAFSQTPGVANMAPVEASPDLLVKEFRLQTLCLQVLREAISNYPKGQSKVAEIGGYENIMDFVLWVTAYFSGAPTKIVREVRPASVYDRIALWSPYVSTDRLSNLDGAGPMSCASGDRKYCIRRSNADDDHECVPLPPPSVVLTYRTKEIAHLFDILGSLYMSAGSPQSGRDDKDKRKSVIPAGTPEAAALLNKDIIRVLIDVYNPSIRSNKDNRDAREGLRTQSPELQLHLIRFLSHQILSNPSCLDHCRSYQIWDVMFSEYFYMCDESLGAEPVDTSASHANTDYSKTPMGIEPPLSSTREPEPFLDSIRNAREEQLLSNSKSSPQGLTQTSFNASSPGESKIKFSIASTTTTVSGFGLGSGNSDDDDIAPATTEIPLDDVPLDDIDLGASDTHGVSGTLSSSAMSTSMPTEETSAVNLPASTQDDSILMASQQDGDTMLATAGTAVEAGSVGFEVFDDGEKNEIKRGLMGTVTAVAPSYTDDNLITMDSSEYLSNNVDETGANTFSALKSLVLMFLEFCGTFAEVDNHDEVRKILEVINEHRTKDPKIVFELATSLATIFQCNMDITLKSLIQIDALPTLCGVIGSFLSVLDHWSVDDGKDGKAGYDVYESALIALLGVVEQFLITREGRLHAICQPLLIQTLTQLICMPQFKPFALHHLLQLMVCVPKDCTDSKINKAESSLFSRVTELFTMVSHSNKGSDEDRFRVVLDLLELVREVVMHDSRRYQRAFRHTDCFIQVMSVLIGGGQRLDDILLCNHVLDTIVVLMANSPKNKESFRETIGYDQISEVVMRIYENKPNKEIMMKMLSVMMDGAFDEEEQYTIRNPDIIRTYFNLLETCDVELMRDMLELLEGCVGKCLLNQSYNSMVGMMDYLMKRVQEENIDGKVQSSLIALIRIIGAFSIQVTELKTFFGILRRSSEKDPSLFVDMCTALQNMTVKEGPSDFFYCDGIGSGLSLPEIDKWPTSKGYSFCTWLRIESSQQAQEPTRDIERVNAPRRSKVSVFGASVASPVSQEYCPRIYSFLTDEGKGFELFLRDDCLVVSVVSRKGKKNIWNPGIKLQKRRWYFVTITHSPSKTFSNKEIRLYIDGNERAKATLKYPHLPVPFNRCFIGTNAVINSHINPIPREMPLFGQLGGLYFFDDVLHPAQVADIHMLGPSYVYSFQSQDTPRLPRMQTNTVSDGTLSQKVFLSYNSSAWDGKYCLDNTPEGAQNRPYPLHAYRLGGLHPCSRQNVTDIIHCLGGIRVLLPLFLEQVKMLRFLSQDSANKDNARLTNVTSTLVRTICYLVRDSDVNQDFLVRSRGFAILSHVLQMLPSECLTCEMVQAMQDFLCGVARNENLKKDALTHLFFNFRLWVYAPLNTQLYLFGILHNYINSEELGMYFSSIGIQRVLDVLRLFYWERPEETISLCVGPLIDPVTKNVIGERPNSEGMRQVRGHLLELLKEMLGDLPTKGDVESLLRHALHAYASVTTEYVLVVIHRALMHNPGHMVSILADLGRYSAFLRLMESPVEGVRVASLAVIRALLNQTADLPQWHIQGVFTSIAGKIMLFPFSRRTCAALFSLLMNSDFSEDNLTIAEDQNIARPEMLGVIFRMLLGAHPELVSTVVHSLLILVIGSDDTNRNTIINQFGWQGWLLSIVSDLRRITAQNEGVSVVQAEAILQNKAAVKIRSTGNSESSEPSPFKNPETETALVVYATIVSMFRRLLYHNVVHIPDGWKAVEATMTTILLFADRGVLDHQNITRELLLGLISSVKENSHVLWMFKPETPTVEREPRLSSSSSNAPSTSVQWVTNLIYVVALIEEFVFNGRIMAEFSLDSGAVKRSLFASSPMDITLPTPTVSKNIQEETHQWEDGLLAFRTVECMRCLGFLSARDFESVEGLSQVDSSYLRNGGMQRLSLRFAGSALYEIFPPSQNTERGRATITQHNGSDIYLELRFSLGELVDAVLADHKAAPEGEEKAAKEALFTIIHNLQRCIRHRNEPGIEDNLAQRSTAAFLHLQVVRKWRHALVQYMKPDGSKAIFGESSLSWVEDYPTDFPERLQNDRTYLEELENRFVGPEWDSFTFYVLEPHSNAIAEREQSFARAAHQRTQKNKQLLRGHIEFTDGVEGEFEKALSSRIQELEAELIPQESERLAEVLAVETEDQRAIRRIWVKIMRELTNERGPWCSDDEKDGQVFWKLDKTENKQRMRIKLKRNYEGSDHKEASNRHYQESEADRERATSTVSDIHVPKEAMGQSEGREPEEEDEDLEAEGNEDGNVDTAEQNDMEEKPVYSTECELVTPLMVCPGKLEITTTNIYFKPRRDLAEQPEYKAIADASESKVWCLAEVREIHYRRYLLRASALEVFLVNNTNFFINLMSKHERSRVFGKLVAQRPPNMLASTSRSPAAVLKKSGLTAKWQKRQISNFEYIMALNTIAGRTYNDPTQYPVFPWILADYHSDTIDLSDPTVYRDLSKPVGALNPKRLQNIVDRYECFIDDETPPFHYGSHYSSAGIVLYYMIRMEPFTTQAIQLQSGKFDHADRLFHSIPATYDGVMNNMSDVKELIPEFFYQPAFLKNVNGFDLGEKQNGEVLSDVVLPPWAKSAEDFVRINREALESEYVSQHLHEWIDLIFGYKQRGPAAVEAHNVFYYLTYEGAVDLDAIEDPLRRKAAESQIANFGQTPSQLLRKSHPRRGAVDPALAPIFNSPEDLKASWVQTVTKDAKDSTVYIAALNDRIVTVGASRVLMVHRWLPNVSDYQGLPFTFELDKNANTKRYVGIPFSVKMSPSPLCFHITPDSKSIISCGHWDRSIKVSALETGRTIQSLVHHKDIVTCLVVGQDGRTMVTGSRDTTLMVWTLVMKGGRSMVEEVPDHVLYGHDDEVTSLAISTDLDIAVSGSKDGTCIVHTLRLGQYIRTIAHPQNKCVHHVAISPQGYFVMYSLDDLWMHLYSINGWMVTSVDTHERKHCILVTSDGKYIVTGGEIGTVVVRDALDLQILYKYDCATVPIRSIALTKEKHLLVGMQDGKMMIYSMELPTLKSRKIRIN